MGVHDGNENEGPFLVFRGFWKIGISLVVLATCLIGRQKNWGDEMSTLVSIYFSRVILFSHVRYYRNNFLVNLRKIYCDEYVNSYKFFWRFNWNYI